MRLERIAGIALLSLVVVGLLFLYTQWACMKTNLLSADLGRHVSNGKWILERYGPYNTNFYSYTYPKYEAPNHHWGSGVVFYLTWKVGGFALVHVLTFGAGLLALLGMGWVSIRSGSLGWTVLAAIAVIPLVAHRREIRPEFFSYLFLALTYVILWHWRERKWKDHCLWLLPPIMLIWANLHIYFAIGGFVIFLFMLERVLRERNTEKAEDAPPAWRFPLIILAACFFATWINPLGPKLGLYPFQIFKDYAYRVAENQSVHFLVTHPSGVHDWPVFRALYATTGLHAASTILLALLDWKRIRLSDLVLSATCGILAWISVRNITMYGLVVLPVLGWNLGMIAQVLNVRSRPIQRYGLAVLTFIVGVTGTVMFYQRAEDKDMFRAFGLGIWEGSDEGAADFIRESDLKGPMLNNYDIGGYLIYKLYPEWKVYVDNRPEAYPGEIFEEEIEPMKKDDAVWSQVLEKHDFNFIAWYVHDMADNVQDFLYRRAHDPAWIPVFFDGMIIVFVRNDERNADVIRKWGRPRAEGQRALRKAWGIPDPQ